MSLVISTALIPFFNFLPPLFCQITLDKCGLYRLVTESMENSTWDYDNAIRNYKEKSLYDTGVTAEYGDKLITLVTCSYHKEHGRFVVVARQR